MTVVTELLDEIESLVSNTSISYSAASAANDLYEGFIFALVVKAAKSAGARVEYLNPQGNRTSDLVFRTSPGMISSTVQPYTYALLSFPNCPPLEAHIGVRVQGRSGVLHECDVVVLDSSEAEACRAKSSAPRGFSSLIAVECKFYASPVGIALAREFHGLHTDLGVKFPQFVTNLQSRQVERFLTYHSRDWENDVRPGTDEAVYLEGHFRQAFRNFKALRS